MAEVIRLKLDEESGVDRPVLRVPKAASGDGTRDSIGQDLRRLREQSGRTPADVCRELKILPHYLLAIEESRFDALPGRVYATGYVRSYAAYLGLNAETSVARLKAEMGLLDASSGTGPMSAPGSRERLEAERDQGGDALDAMFRSSQRSLSQALLTGLFIGLALYLGFAWVSAKRLTQPAVAPVPAELAAEAGLGPRLAMAPVLIAFEHAISAPALLAIGPVSTAWTVLAPPLQPVKITTSLSRAPVPAAGDPRARRPHESGLRAAKDGAPKRSLVAAAPGPRLHAPLPLGERYGLRNTNSRIVLRMHRATRIAIEGAHDRVFIDRILHSGDTYRVPDLPGLHMSAPDAGAVELIVDGTTIGFAGRDGAEARNLLLEPKGIVRHKPGR